MGDTFVDTRSLVGGAECLGGKACPWTNDKSSSLITREASETSRSCAVSTESVARPATNGSIAIIRRAHLAYEIDRVVHTAARIVRILVSKRPSSSYDSGTRRGERRSFYESWRGASLIGYCRRGARAATCSCAMG